jgi:uncharacterized protein YjeT (DUF2065 family)
MSLPWTRISLFYLASYVVPAGLTLLLAPDLALRMFQSNTTYDTEPMRLAGIALTSLGAFVVQMIRLRLEALYTTTLAVRVFIVSSLAWLYATSGNPFFLVLVAIVGLGFVLTLTAYVVDTRAA